MDLLPASRWKRKGHNLRGLITPQRPRRPHISAPHTPAFPFRHHLPAAVAADGCCPRHRGRSIQAGRLRKRRKLLGPSMVAGPLEQNELRRSGSVLIRSGRDRRMLFTRNQGHISSFGAFWRVLRRYRRLPRSEVPHTTFQLLQWPLFKVEALVGSHSSAAQG